MANKAGRGTTKNIFFKNQEMNFTVLRALMGVYDDGHFEIRHFEEIISVDYFFQFIKSKGLAIQTEIK